MDRVGLGRHFPIGRPGRQLHRVASRVHAPVVNGGRDLHRVDLASPTRDSPQGHLLMYSDTMGRTQIYLGEEELKLLDRAVRETGASRSELIRRAVRATFGGQAAEERLRALKASAGSWRDRSGDGAAYVEEIRSGDVNERLARLGVR